MAATRPISIPEDSHPFPFEESLVVARPPDPCLFLLNPTARMIWECLRAGLDVEEAAWELSAATGIALEIARHDVHSSVSQWEQQGLLGSAASSSGDGAKPRRERLRQDPQGQAAAATRTYRLLEWTFAIAFEDEELLRAIHPRYANLEQPAGSAADVAIEVFRAEDDGVAYSFAGQVVSTPSLQAASHRLFFDLAAAAHPRAQIAASLHGGVLSRAGASVLLVGQEGSGKSTLNAALLHAGFNCLGDDRALLEAGSMRPMASPNAIGLKAGSWSVLSVRYPKLETWPVHRIGGKNVRYVPTPAPTTRLAPPARAVIFPRFDPGAQTALARLSSTEALQRIVSAHAWVEPTKCGIDEFLRWVQSVPCYALPYASLDEALLLIGELVPP